ncbi:4-hydroxybenzoate polyprenyltransferase, mitochondrial [Cytospora mali]|uniref:Diterpenoid pyrone biosynthesis cluster protein C n=1 Tax=Cytospora mali TaxID=578113 RepID=A0A194WB62_CYTMA|nr:4-hydroxybenzoate polyprenyltransferase, mitochondrial [Valsa mali]
MASNTSTMDIMAEKPKPLTPSQDNPSFSSTAALAQQYGGSHTGSWVTAFPASWIPYIQLARLSPPAGLFLIYFPHFFGGVLGATVTNASLGMAARTGLVLLAGSFFLSNAAHAWNDIVDEPIDRAVARTRKRPIVRGAVSQRAAVLFAVSQAVGALSVLLAFLPTGSLWFALPNIAAITYYPLAKRHTHFAQIVLGVCLAWGVFIGSVAFGHEPFAFGHFKLAAGKGPNPQGLYVGYETAYVDVGALSLFVACVLWTAIYDSVYAHQDVEDDVKLGLKSMAVLLRGHIKPALGLMLAAMLSSLAFCGHRFGFGLLYYVFSMTGPSLVLGAMTLRVDLQSSASCWWWFKHGFWAVGWSISLGFLTQYHPFISHE